MRPDDPRVLLSARIADSPGFRRAPRLRDLFLYVMHNGIAGRDDLLSEHQIGQNVFGRNENYNASEDNIVRSQMRLLRKKLETWSASDGAGESLHVVIPKGSYVPHFEERAVETEPILPVELPQLPPAAPPADTAAHRTWRLPAAFALIALLGACAGWFARPGASGGRPDLNPILAKLVQQDRPTLIVVQDASLTLLNNALRSEFPLEQFQSGEYKQQLRAPDLAPDYARLLRIIDARQYTSIGDLSVVRNLLQAVPSDWGQLQVVHPRHLHLRQLKSSNAILIGGSQSNPWVQLYTDKLDFRLTRMPDRSGLCVQNLRPRPGEPPSWCPADQDTFGLFALIPQTGGPGNVLLMAGASLEATEAAGEMIVSRNSARKLVADIERQLGSNQFTSFQAVIRCSGLGGTAARREIVALRATGQH